MSEDVGIELRTAATGIGSQTLTRLDLILPVFIRHKLDDLGLNRLCFQYFDLISSL